MRCRSYQLSFRSTTRLALFGRFSVASSHSDQKAVIVVDDGSADNPAQILRALEGPPQVLTGASGEIPFDLEVVIHFGRHIFSPGAAVAGQSAFSLVTVTSSKKDAEQGAALEGDLGRSLPTSQLSPETTIQGRRPYKHEGT